MAVEQIRGCGYRKVSGLYLCGEFDPPYSEEKAKNLYAVPLVSVTKLLQEAGRVVRVGGFVVLLDLRVWPPPDCLDWEALIAVYIANRGPKPLRALSVFKKIKQ